MKKKNLWMLGAAVLTATACSNVDVVKEGAAPQVNAIQFDNHVNKTTRAIDNTTFSEFYVYGSYTAPNITNTHYTIFNGVDAVTSKNGSTGPWDYSNHRFWIPGANYRFYACSNENGPVTGEGRVSFSNGELQIVDYLCDGSTGHQKDLVFADLVTHTGLESANPPVSFDFKHLLARLTFVFETTFAADNKILIEKFRVNNIRNQGDYDATQKEWINVERTPSGSNPTVNPLFKGLGSAYCQAGTDKPQSDFVYVIPFTYEQANVDIIFDITVTNAADQKLFGRTLKATWAPKWETGKSYLYTVTINGSAAGIDPIEFKVKSVTDWEEGTPGQPNLGVDAGKKPEPGA